VTTALLAGWWGRLSASLQRWICLRVYILYADFLDENAIETLY